MLYFMIWSRVQKTPVLMKENGLRVYLFLYVRVCVSVFVCKWMVRTSKLATEQISLFYLLKIKSFTFLFFFCSIVNNYVRVLSEQWTLPRPNEIGLYCLLQISMQFTIIDVKNHLNFTKIAMKRHKQKTNEKFYSSIIEISHFSKKKKQKNVTEPTVFGPFQLTSKYFCMCVVVCVLFIFFEHKRKWNFPIK